MLLRIAIPVFLLLPFISGSGAAQSWFLQPEHWLQFALCLGCVICLLPAGLWRRAQADVWTLTLLAGCILTLVPGFLRQSAWLLFVSFCCSAAVAGGSLQVPVRRRLLLVLLVALPGLPTGMQTVISRHIDDHLLQISSTVASLLNIWHSRADHLLATPLGTLDTSLILKSPLSFTGVYAIIAGLMLLNYRPTIQILFMLPVTATIVWLMQSVSCVLALADIADGVQWIAPQHWSLLLLPCTSLLLWSSIQLKILLTHGIIPPDRDVSPELLLNTCSCVWDRFVDGTPIEIAGPVQLWDFNEHCLSPNIRPVSFLKDWWYSRKTYLLPYAAPAMVLFMAVPFFDLLIVTVQQFSRQRYQLILEQAQSRQNTVLQDICLQQLASGRPADPVWQLRRAEFLFKNSSRLVGYNEFVRLASQQDNGLAAAHLWLAEHALSPNPVERLSEEEIIQHLREALEATSTRARAHAVLGQVYRQRGENSLADRHLYAAADLDPKFTDNLLLRDLTNAARLRNDSRVLRRLRQLTQELDQSPENSTLRIHLAVLLTAVGDVSQAEELIKQGRQILDQPNLKKAAADLLLHRANAELNSGYRNGDDSLLAVREAMRLNPGSPLAASLAARLTSEGADLTRDVEEPIKYWNQYREKHADHAAARALACLYLAARTPGESIEELNQLTISQPGDVLLKVTALMQNGNGDKALQLARREADAWVAKGGLSERVAAADLLCRAKACSEACLLLDSANTTQRDVGVLVRAKAITALDELDYLLNYPGHYATLTQLWTPSIPDQLKTQIFSLINNALPIADLRPRIADRLYVLTLAGGDYASEAEATLQRFRAAGGNVSEILTAIGSRALQFNRYHDALRWLQLAQATATQTDPVLCNNLALAIARAEASDLYDLALKNADDAVRLMPGNYLALTTRAEVYLTLGTPRLALQDLQAAILVRPDDPETLRMLSRAFNELGDRESAEKYYRQAEAALKQRV